MPGRISLEELKRAIRSRVCTHCPIRRSLGGCPPDAAAPCEAQCPVFKSLPALKRQMEQLDPMLVSYDQALNRTVDEILQNQRRGSLRDWWHSPLRRNRKRVVETVVQRVRP
jgi:hypothetical protein